MVSPRPISVSLLRFGVRQGRVLMPCAAVLLTGCGGTINEAVEYSGKSQPQLTADSAKQAQHANRHAPMAREGKGGYLTRPSRVEHRSSAPVRAFAPPSMSLDLRAGDHFAIQALQNVRDRKAKMAAGRIFPFADAPESGTRKFSRGNPLGFAGREGLSACLAHGRIDRVVSAVCIMI